MLALQFVLVPLLLLLALVPVLVPFELTVLVLLLLLLPDEVWWLVPLLWLRWAHVQVDELDEEEDDVVVDEEDVEEIRDGQAGR